MKKNVCIIGFSILCPVLSFAQAMGVAGGGGTESRSAVTSISDGGIIAPFQYIAPVDEDATKKENTPPRSRVQQRIMDLNNAGDYQTAGTEGVSLMATEKLDDELQLIVANSLAWTGRVKEAVPVYQGISKGPYANQANLGLANINRWRGRDDLAKPVYQSILEKDASNMDAQEGLALAKRELSPRTTLTAGVSEDSSNLKRRLGAVNHRWRDQTGANIFEVESSGFYDWMPTDAEAQRDLTLRYQGLALPLKPSLELNMPTRLNPSLYGTAKIKLLDDLVTLGAGRINWGKAVANPIAERQGLSASYLSAEIMQSFTMGSLAGRVNYYGVSDGNVILTTGLDFNSAWRPLGSHFKPFAGVETRSAQKNVSTYWSPAQGSGSIYAGLMGEWSDADWSFFASAQLGAPLFGDAGSSWSVSAGGKRWLTNDIALGMNLWSMASWRDNATYRARSLNVNLEKLWN